MSWRASWHHRGAPDLGDGCILTENAHRTAANAAREHYSRLVASLAAQFHDVAAAEDALADSLVAALTQWPMEGVPDNPAAWLLTVARRKLADNWRRHKVATAVVDDLLAETRTTRPSPMRDGRLDLLFACAHPAIGENVRAPLMLQVVFGLDATAIASLFLMSAPAMAQRLVRAKQKIRDARIPFHVPEPEEYSKRLQFVLMAIYALFTRDGKVWHEAAGNRDSLADEAIWLGHLVLGLSNRHPEALGLMALMLFVESRRLARRDSEGRFVPLLEQSVALWDRQMIGRAENLLREAGEKKTLGRFQLEAAIQSAHAARATTGWTDWPAILALYDGLLAIAPTLVARTNRAVALLHVGGPERAIVELEAIASDPRIADYQPYWAARAHVLEACGRSGEVAACLGRAIELEADESVRDFLKGKMRRATGNGI